jgi:methylated-DNA-[protein]-cysteine S-methyltransferase
MLTGKDERGRAAVIETEARAETTVATPVGELAVVAADGVLVEIRLPGHLRAGAADRATRPRRPDARGADAVPPVLIQARRQLDEYFAGRRREFDLPLRPEGTGFQRAVWDSLRDVGYAHTTTYADLARAIGRPGAARAVGAALGRNPLPIVVPCHRVVGADGGLTGFGGGIAMKRFLLDLEANARGTRSTA